MKNKVSSGFSLVELSVVLVIIGLIIAAIAGGSHMLHTAKLNTVISELRGYATGVENFRNKYNYWPGDLPNAATDYWGAYNATTNPTGVLNGDGDEELYTASERFQAWSHMAKAGFITGDYDGTGTANGHGVGGVNIPQSSAIDNLTYFINITDSYGTGGVYVAVKKGSGFNGILNSADSYYIDKKIDDGDKGVSSAGTGNLFAIRGDNVAATADKCVDKERTEAPPVEYVLTDFDANCRVLFWLEKD
ncbi:MAG: hypothetical protein COV35_06055 [Alphaproteobacteria bacterium CG11_big_fil_rev_8_21_14_0_20_39_49]|nr:MAG: hypothetical protein COV35_06055 [Alphaproteobacteria bacterium CG11_big_fil_rev_8_21_14_0_20_39_49]